MVELTRRLGREIGRLGFRGMFGADWILTPGEDLFLLEINPRFQGSTLLLSELEEAAGRTPLVAHHLRAFGVEVPLGEDSEPPCPSVGWQRLIYAEADLEYQPGMLRQVPPGPAYSIHGTPRPGTRVRKGALLARVVSRDVPFRPEAWT